MKIVVHPDFGGFHFGDEFCETYNVDPYDYDEFERNDPRLVDWVEKHPDDNEELEVVEIPDNVTDWQIIENDGAEDIIAVIDGKIRWF